MVELAKDLDNDFLVVESRGQRYIVHTGSLTEKLEFSVSLLGRGGHRKEDVQRVYTEKKISPTEWVYTQDFTATFISLLEEKYG